MHNGEHRETKNTGAKYIQKSGSTKKKEKEINKNKAKKEKKRPQLKISTFLSRNKTSCTNTDSTSGYSQDVVYKHRFNIGVLTRRRVQTQIQHRGTHKTSCTNTDSTSGYSQDVVYKHRFNIEALTRICSADMYFLCSTIFISLLQSGK